MRSVFRQLFPHWRRLSIAGLLVVIALMAGLFNLVRPITRSEAIRIVTAQWRTIPGSDTMPNLQPRALRSQGSTGLIWVVDFDDPATGEPFAQVSLNRTGKPLSVVLGY